LISPTRDSRPSASEWARSLLKLQVHRLGKFETGASAD
jgi:hypothetical protein